MAQRPYDQRDKFGSALRATLTAQEYKRLDALFQAKALVNEMAQGERLLAKFVSDARKQGATWAEIGAAVGVTAQTAHSRWSVHKRVRTKTSEAAKKARVPVKREVQPVLL